MTKISYMNYRYFHHFKIYLLHICEIKSHLNFSILQNHLSVDTLNVSWKQYLYTQSKPATVDTQYKLATVDTQYKLATV